MSNPGGESVRQIVNSVTTGAVTRLSATERSLALAATVNPRIGALVELRSDDARRDASAADRAGHRGGLLDGVPVSVKAEYDVAGMSTTHGNADLTDNMAIRDAPVVARLRAHGAIIIGKGNQPDFAMRWNTHSSQTGWTKNPRDTTLSVGGSSGGDAAAVAAGLVTIGFGTDLAGSIRVPAAFCQIYGLRATPGRIPYASMDLHTVRSPAVEAMSSQGPMARSVDDLEIAFEVTAGASREHPFSTSARRYAGRRHRPGRVARLVHQAGAQVTAELEERVDMVCATLERAGYVVEDAAFPGAERAPDLWGELLCTELRLRALPRLRAQMDPSCADHIDKLSSFWPTIRDTSTYVERWQEWTQMRRQLQSWLERYPLIVSPIAGISVPLPLEYDHWVDSGTLETFVHQMRNSLWPACLGLPALALPNGVQLVAGPHRDEALFAPARAIEAVLPACTPAAPPADTKDV
jgi:amidase